MQNKSPSRNIQENWNYKLVNYMWTVFSVSQSGLLKSVVISEACKVEGVIHILSNLLYMSVVLNCVNTAWNIMILNLVACKVFVHTQMCQQSTQIQISRADSSCWFKYFSPCWRFEFGTVLHVVPPDSVPFMHVCWWWCHSTWTLYITQSDAGSLILKSYWDETISRAFSLRN